MLISFHLLHFYHFLELLKSPWAKNKNDQAGSSTSLLWGVGFTFLWIQNLYLWDPPSQICFQSATPNHSMSTTVIRPCYYQTSQTTCLMNVKLLNCICCWLYTCHYYILWNTMQHTEWYTVYTTIWEHCTTFQYDHLYIRCVLLLLW